MLTNRIDFDDRVSLKIRLLASISRMAKTWHYSQVFHRQRLLLRRLHRYRYGTRSGRIYWRVTSLLINRITISCILLLLMSPQSQAETISPSYVWGFGSGFSHGFDPVRPVSGDSWDEFRSNMVAAVEEGLLAGMGPGDCKIQYNFPVGNLTFENLDDARQAGNGRFLLNR